MGIFCKSHPYLRIGMEVRCEFPKFTLKGFICDFTTKNARVFIHTSIGKSPHLNRHVNLPLGRLKPAEGEQFVPVTNHKVLLPQNIHYDQLLVHRETHVIYRVASDVSRGIITAENIKTKEKERIYVWALEVQSRAELIKREATTPSTTEPQLHTQDAPQMNTPKKSMSLENGCSIEYTENPNINERLRGTLIEQNYKGNPAKSLIILCVGEIKAVPTSSLQRVS